MSIIHSFSLNLWVIITVICCCILYGTYWYVKPRKKQLSPGEIKHFMKMLDQAYDLDSKFGIIQIDTVVEGILKAKGGKGNLGSMLRTLPKGNVTNDLWKYHKIRNILVHESQGTAVSRKDVELFVDIAKSLLRERRP